MEGIDKTKLAPFLVYNDELHSAVESGQICLLRLVLAKLESSEPPLSKADIGNTPAFNGDVMAQFIAKTGNDGLFQWVADSGYGCSDIKVMTESRKLVAEKASISTDSSYYRTLALIQMLKDKHRLTGRYYTVLHMYLLYLPGTAVSSAAAILSFIASASQVSPKSASTLILIVGALSILSALIQTMSDQLQLSGKALQHTAAADELAKILTDLEFGFTSRGDLQAIRDQVHSIGKTCRYQMHSTMEALFDELVGELQELREQASKEGGYEVPQAEMAEKRKADINSVTSAIAADKYWPWTLRAQKIKHAVIRELRSDTLRLLSSHRSTAGDTVAADATAANKLTLLPVFDLLVLLYQRKANPTAPLPVAASKPPRPAHHLGQAAGGGKKPAAGVPSATKPAAPVSTPVNMQTPAAKTTKMLDIL